MVSTDAGQTESGLVNTGCTGTGAGSHNSGVGSCVIKRDEVAASSPGTEDTGVTLNTVGHAGNTGTAGCCIEVVACGAGSAGVCRAAGHTIGKSTEDASTAGQEVPIRTDSAVRCLVARDVRITDICCRVQQVGLKTPSADPGRAETDTVRGNGHTTCGVDQEVAQVATTAVRRVYGTGFAAGLTPNTLSGRVGVPSESAVKAGVGVGV